MYIAKYEAEEATWYQVLIHINSVCVPSGKENRWNKLLASALKMLSGVDKVHWSMRISVNNGNLYRTILLQYTNYDDDFTSGIIAPFLRMNNIREQSVTIPAREEDHDALLHDFSPMKYWHKPIEYEWEEARLVERFNIYDHLQSLITESLRTGQRLDYQANICPYSLPLESKREIQKNVVRLQAEPDCPGALKQHQTRMVENAIKGNVLIEEFLGTDESPGAYQNLLARLHNTEMQGCGFPEPEFEFQDAGEFEELLYLGLHSSLALSATTFEQAAQAGNSKAQLGKLFIEEEWPEVVLLCKNHFDLESIDQSIEYLIKIEERLSTIESQLGDITDNNYCHEMKNAVSIAKVDPPFSLAKARNLLELIVVDLYIKETGNEKIKPLFNMIADLTSLHGLFPKKIAAYLDNIRIMGNAAVHPTVGGVELSDSDIQITLLMTVELIEWYLINYTFSEERVQKNIRALRKKDKGIRPENEQIITKVLVFDGVSIDGRWLMNCLGGVSGGPEIGKILRIIEDEAAKGNLQSEEDCVGLVSSLKKRNSN